jgi:hypothetical protein
VFTVRQHARIGPNTGAPCRTPICFANAVPFGANAKVDRVFGLKAAAEETSVGSLRSLMGRIGRRRLRFD